MEIYMKEAENREETSGLSPAGAKKIYKRWKALKKSNQQMTKIIETMRKEKEENELKLKLAEEKLKVLETNYEKLRARCVDLAAGREDYNQKTFKIKIRNLEQ